MNETIQLQDMLAALVLGALSAMGWYALGRHGEIRHREKRFALETSLLWGLFFGFGSLLLTLGLPSVFKVIALTGTGAGLLAGAQWRRFRSAAAPYRSGASLQTTSDNGFTLIVRRGGAGLTGSITAGGALFVLAILFPFAFVRGAVTSGTVIWIAALALAGLTKIQTGFAARKIIATIAFDGTHLVRKKPYKSPKTWDPTRIEAVIIRHRTQETPEKPVRIVEGVLACENGASVSLVSGSDETTVTHMLTQIAERLSVPAKDEP